MKSKCNQALAQLAQDEHLQARILRFIEDRTFTTDGGCHEFVGVTTKKGYGVICFLGAHVHAQRVAWVAANRRMIPDGLMVMHQCNNRACVNPTHLEVGTNAQNMRYAKLSGSYQNYQKLTRENVVEAARLFVGGMSMRRISLMLGVNHSHISRVFQGKAWGECFEEVREILEGRAA
jgi:hypothetical protein